MNKGGVWNEYRSYSCLTGDGSGKTTSALGMALRAIGHGYKVHLIMSAKDKQDCGEILASKILPQLETTIAGRDHFADRKNPEPIDFELAQKGLKQARELNEQRIRHS